jgi:hypothetical protein
LNREIAHPQNIRRGVTNCCKCVAIKTH